MNKLSLKNIITFAGTTLLSVSVFFTNATHVYAEVPGKYLSADMGEADLLGIASKYPTLFWTAFIVLVLLGIGYCIYHFTKRKEKQV